MIPFPTTGLHPTDIDELLTIYQQLKITYGAEVDTVFGFELRLFSVFNNNGLLNHGPVFRMRNGNTSFYLNYLQLHFVSGRSGYNTGIQGWGYIELSKNYGHILIKHETILDKIQDLIHPVDIDFTEDPLFSKRFHVVADDKDKATEFLSASVRDLIKEIPLEEVLIEIVDNTLIIGNEQMLGTDTAEAIVSFLNKLARRL